MIGGEGWARKEGRRRGKEEGGWRGVGGQGGKLKEDDTGSDSALNGELRVTQRGRGIEI